MNYKKLVADTFRIRSNNNSQIAAAVLIGVAVGAALSVLFAPKSGDDIRSRIANRFRSQVDDLTEEEEYVEPDYVKHPAPKKPKSDIKDLIHEAHHPEHNNA